MARTETVTVVFTDLVGSTELANRLGHDACAAAAAGQILVSDVVRLLARGKGQTFTAVGELALKGLPEPLPTAEVRWEPLSAAPGAGVPLPPRLTTTHTVAMIGRAAEQEVLAQAWKKV